MTNYRALIIGILLLMHPFKDGISQSDIPRLSQIDIQHYTFAIELSDSTDIITGNAVVTILFLKDTDEFMLDLYRKDSGGYGMEVLEVSAADYTLKYDHFRDILTIQAGQTIVAGKTVSFNIRYKGIPKDGLVIDINKYGDRTFFGDNWPNRAHHWLPCVDHPSDKAGVEFIVTAPDHYQVVSNGIQIEELNLSDEMKVTHWKETVPIPMKVAVIGVARFGVQYAGDVYGIPVSSWIYHQDRLEGYHDYSQALEILQFFIDQIGPYPYQKLANVQSKTRYGGMENASSIFYFENSVTGKAEQEKLIAHEIAHQWFGNAASEQNWHHIWLSEGFATYGADLYLEHKYNRARMVEELETERLQVIRYASNTPRPVVDTNVYNWNKLLNPNSYQKGAWILHMLRREVGEHAFWKGLQQYYSEYAGGNAVSGDFQKIMEMVSGKKLHWFFQQWLYRAGHPDLKVNWKHRTKKLIIDIQQTQNVPFQFPLDILAVDKSGQKKRWTIDVNASHASYQLKCKNFIPEQVIVDPDVWLLYRAEVKRMK